MKKKHGVSGRKICVLLGIALLTAAMVMLLAWRLNTQVIAQRAESYVHVLYALIPEPQGAALENRRDNTMPALSMEGTDFIGMIEMPLYESVLPVCAHWGKVSHYPCCYGGSIYDGSIQIGATSQKGQYDFYREISVGDALFFTDMTGDRYAYEVTNLRYVKNVDQATLQQDDAALTLFIKNVYAFEYIIVSCAVSD